MKRSFSLLLFVLLLGCQAAPAPDNRMAGPAPFTAETGAAVSNPEDLLIVDCLVPGQMRKIGRQMIYLTPRRPLKTTALDCEIRGGEYVAADLADYRSALKVWENKAAEGDPVAQTYVGEIYQKGLGTAPNYALAAQWYQRAAEQGYSRAQINLAQLYEQGLGVAQNKLTALNLYRQASGLPKGLSLDGTAAEQNLLEEVKGLREELERRRQELDNLRQQLNSLQSGAQRQAALAQKNYTKEISRLEQHIGQLQRLLKQKDQQLPPGNQPEQKSATIPPIEFGRYYALVIGNDKYDNFEDLTTAVNDARELGQILKNHYGFDYVKILENGKYLQILTELNRFRQNIARSDNFLLYFAGHGKFNQRNKRGFWLPTDALKDNQANWISNTTITDYLNDMAAKRVLVVADSCYAGIMAGSAVPVLSVGTAEALDIKWLKTIASKRSRTVLTSGGLEPVNDVGDGKHSLFAKVLLGVLRDNGELLEGQKLYVRVAPTVESATSQTNFPQEPRYAPIQYAGHEYGEFFFVPVSSVSSRRSEPLLANSGREVDTPR